MRHDNEDFIDTHFSRRLVVDANASVLTYDDMHIQWMLTLRRSAEIKSRKFGFGALFTQFMGKR